MTIKDLAKKAIQLVERGYGNSTVQVKNQYGKFKPITGFYSVDEYQLLDIVSDNEEGE